MRHSTLDLMMNVYTDPRLLDVHGALDSLPELTLSDGRGQAEQATGTTESPDLPNPNPSVRLALPPCKPSQASADADNVALPSTHGFIDVSGSPDKRSDPLSSPDSG